ncbi:MAG: asparagine synthase (glutamine-hydrolyzing) [Lentisphaeria bacterium]|nr:asparagine synthase (glutamine-hydrolyzing) [Lentisphaeria bacterium]
MCGIVGFINLNGDAAERKVISRMTDAMTHRGPDGGGVWLSQAAALGHRRLAVLDLSDRAAQPMVSPDSRWTIVYNGEIYNYRELRSELCKAGHEFRTGSDTEVVLHAVMEWGKDAVPKFNGHFAFAVYDQLRKELFLARDRFGVKPLYWCRTGGIFAFASEQKALLCHPSVGAELDRKALLEYFTFQNLFSGRTFFQGISTFPPGNYATVAADGTMDLHEYWDYDFREPEKAADEAEYEEELCRLFSQAVTRQLQSDVEVGSYLSGGIDSGSITAIAASRIPNIKTFTCGFDRMSEGGLETAFDERPKAEYMSYLFKTEHYEMVLKAGDMENCMENLVRSIETPKVGQSYPNYYTARMAGKFVKIVLGGGGGDELFGGYPWRYYRAIHNDDFEDYIDKYYLYWQRLIPNSIIKKVFAPIAGEVRDVWTRDIFRDVFRHHDCTLSSPEAYVNHSLYFEAKTFLCGLMEIDDKLHMAHGIEQRMPFLDNDLVDFAMKVPVRLKLGQFNDEKRINENEITGQNAKFLRKHRDGKLLLRRAISRYVPEQISSGEKMGFSAPDEKWFRGDSIEFVKRVIMTPKARIYQFLDRASVYALVNEHLTGQVNRRLLIWSLLNFEYWLKIFGGNH